MAEIISLREFARRMEVSDKTVRDAIRLEKIKEGISSKNGKPKVDFEIAKREFENFNVGYRSKLRGETKKEIKDKSNTKVRKQKDNQIEPSDESAESFENISTTSSLADLQKAEKFYKAQSAKREFEKESGDLVYIREVREQLAGFGQFIKSELELYPNNCISKLEDCEGDRAKMLEVLSVNVRDLLLRISNKLTSN
jgi:DNA-binding transcriptional MocR family regulator